MGYIKQQDSGYKIPQMEVKMTTMCEGKEELPSGRRHLSHRQTVAGIMSGRDLCERLTELASRHWYLAQEQTVVGDGVKWINKDGTISCWHIAGVHCG